MVITESRDTALSPTKIDVPESINVSRVVARPSLTFSGLQGQALTRGNIPFRHCGRYVVRYRRVAEVLSEAISCDLMDECKLTMSRDPKIAYR